MKKIVILVFSMVLLAHCFISVAQQDVDIFNRFLKYAAQKDIATQPVDQQIISIASFFLDVPYVGGTLEGDSIEQLRINLHELDCTTLVENVIALHRMFQNGEPSYESFCRSLQYVRYRNGNLNGYLSRLHYTSDWIDNNQHKGMVSLPVLTARQPFSPNVSFMSTHCDSYPALKSHPEWCASIKNVEARVNKLHFTYIPKEKVNDSEPKIHHGDIVAVTTQIEGLDVAHVGFAYVRDGKLYLLHASSQAKKVVVSDETLRNYLAARKSHSGIIVVRAL